jgi:hypothetical protein
MPLATSLSDTNCPHQLPVYACMCFNTRRFVHMYACMSLARDIGWLTVVVGFFGRVQGLA